MAHFYSRAPSKQKSEERKRVRAAPWKFLLSCFRPTDKPSSRSKSSKSRETVPISDSETKHVVPPARGTTPVSLSGTTIQAKPSKIPKPWRRSSKAAKHRTSLNSKLPLLSFPNEILIAIVENLELDDMKSLLLTNRSLAFVITPTYQQHAMEAQGFQKSLDFPEIHWAAWKGHVSLVQQFLDRGFDVNSRTMVHGTTPLHHAARWGHKTVVKLLLDRGAEIDAQDTFDGKTPLHLARLEGRSDIIKILLGRGANTGIKDDAGRTALSYTYGSSNSDYHWRPRDTRQTRKRAYSGSRYMSLRH